MYPDFPRGPLKLFFFLAMFLFPALSWAKPVVVLDAAHGGSDTGIKAGSEAEKDWDLRFAKAIAQALESEGFEVIQVRERDETIPLDKRAETINTARVAAVLVLHADYEWTGKRTGPMIVVEPPTAGGETAEIPRWGVTTPYQYRASLKLGRDIAQALGQGTELSDMSDTRGLVGEPTSAHSRLFCLPHQSLRYLAPPAVVLTPLFLSSPADIRKFSTESGLADFAAQVARGLVNFLQ